jgi:hypothetical protein
MITYGGGALTLGKVKKYQRSVLTPRVSKRPSEAIWVFIKCQITAFEPPCVKPLELSGTLCVVVSTSSSKAVF